MCVYGLGKPMSAESQFVVYACADVRHTLKGVLEMVGWRKRDDTGVKPTLIGVPSSIGHVNKEEA